MNTDKYYVMTEAIPYPSGDLSLPDAVALRRDYHNSLQTIKDKFRDDLFIDLGIESNPKRELFFSIVWEHSHSGGYSEVSAFAEDMVVLIKDVKQ